MLRLSKKVHARGPLQLHAQASCGITTHQMILNESNRSDKRKSMLDLYGAIDGNTGVLKMNREHRFNTLTPHFMESLSRGLQTMDIDHIVKVVYLGSERNQHFSNGTDFRLLKFLKQEQNMDKMQDYLERVYRLQCQVAKINKPVVSVANGHAYNSGASLLASSAFPLTTLDTKIAFNECTFGFVPHSGASFHLSRLPGEFGTFMALTGLPIHGSDAARMGLSAGVITQTRNYEEDVADIVSSQEFPRPSAKDLFARSNDSRNFTAWEEHLLNKSRLKYNAKVGDVNRMYNQKLDSSIREDFIEATERVPSGVSKAELRYMQTIRKDFEKHEQSEGYLSFGENALDRQSLFRFRNHFDEQMTYLKMHLGQSYPKDSGFAANHAQLIDRCFMGDSVEQIMANLRQESHPFAKQCLAAMENNSMLSMKLALKMLRQAQNLDYTKTLKMELRVIAHKLQDSDFDRGIQQVLLSPKAKGGSASKNDFEKEVKDSTVEQYFSPTNMSESINLGVVDQAILPTRMFYSSFSDQARLWLNEESSTNEDIRNTFESEAKQCLQMHGIDVRDKALTTASARQAINAQLSSERRSKVHQERISQLMLDSKLRQNYFKQITDSLEGFKQNPVFYYERLNAHISDIFETAYLERVGKIFQSSKEAQSLEKRRMLVRFKKFLFKSRILTYQNEEMERQIRQLAAMPFKQIHLQEDWDKSFREMENPQIEQSPIYHITKVVGRINMTPAELTKQYLSSKESPASLYTFDEKELKALQADIIENPEKYEIMFTRPEQRIADVDRVFRGKDHKQERMDEYEYWYRVINDGHSPLDSLPYAQEFAAYKNWVDNINEKAVDTLKFAVNRLILDLEQEQVTFDGRGPNREKLQTLLGLINGEKPQKSARNNKRGSSRQLKSASRSIQELDQVLDDVLTTDFTLKQLFGSSKNQRVTHLQNEARQELLKLIEIVLLDKFGHVNPKHLSVLEQRLAQMTNPVGVTDSVGQLRVIDSYLADKNTEVVLREAIDLVKPFFLQSFRQRLLDEADKCFEHLHHRDNHYHVLYHYIFNQQFPGYQDHAVVKRLQEFSLDKEQHELLAACFPFMSYQYREKVVKSMLGQAEAEESKNLSLEKRQEISIEQTRRELSMLRDLVKNNEELQAKWREEALKFQKSETLLQEQLERVNTLSVDEDIELENILMKSEAVLNLMHKMQYELSNNFTEFDWLKIYGDAISKQNIDMNLVNKQRISIDGYKEDNASIEKKVEQQWRNHEEWESLAEYASFISDFGNAINTLGSGPYADLTAFMGKGDSSDKIGQESIFRQSIAWRDSEIQQANLKTTFDRQQVLHDQIDEFNQVQESLQRVQSLRLSIQKISETKPTETRKLVSDLLTRKYVDLDKLYGCLVAGEAITEVQNLVDVDRLVRDFQQGKTMSHAQNYADIHIDVLSLKEAQIQIQNDSSLSKADKSNLSTILKHVENQTLFVSNAQRQLISLGEFLSRHHFTNSDVYSKYSSDILQKKLDMAVNPPAADSIVDWQLGQSRSHPVDVAEPQSPEQLESYLKSVENEIKLEERAENVHSYNEALDKLEISSRRDFELRRILREAQSMTELTLDQESTKNMYQNIILAALGNSEYEEAPIKDVIASYTKFRMNNCMLREGFQDAVRNSQNGHIYLKVLKERVIEELGLDKFTDITDLTYETLNQTERKDFHYDLETPYSLENINNTNAIGYDNLLQRATAKTAKDQADLAQQTVFDKLLAEYFLSKRAEYKQSNQTIRDLATVFEQEGKTFDETILLQRVGKETQPRFQAENMRDLMDLDTAVSRALQKGKNGLSEALRQSTKEENLTEIPEYYEVFDARKPAETYVDDKLLHLVQEVFDIRRKLEKNLSRRELIAFDRVIARHLSHENFMPQLQEAINADYNELSSGKNIIQQAEESKKDFDAQVMKFENKQREYTKSIQNEDAEFKQLAYSGMLERINREKLDKNKDVIEMMFNTDSFHEFYRQELKADAQRPPRPIDEAEYSPKKPWQIKSGDQFRNKRQQEEDYFKEHAVYLENKKEQQERMQMFYILEQFFEKSRQNPDPLSEAQQHIQEYFKEPQNTFFFDKNKL